MSQDQNKKAIAIAFALGMELLGLVLGGIFLGYFAGKMFLVENEGAVIGCLIGFILWFWRLVKTKRYLI
jgi:F0F1-type ATP synthase assembly protein I